MRYEDENGKVGKYSGDVNDDHQPHGQGKMKYKDGSVYEGVWSEGSQVHGKTAKSRSSSSGRDRSGGGSSSRGDAKSGSKSKSSSSDWARRDPTPGKSSSSNGVDQPQAGGASSSSSSGVKKVVRKLKWMDYYGDPGEYSGEVDKSNMPNGKGTMKYDHGLVQEGLWDKGQFVEGSDVHNGDDDVEKKSSSKKSSSGSAGAAGGAEKSSRKPSSSKTSSGKRDP